MKFAGRSLLSPTEPLLITRECSGKDNFSITSLASRTGRWLLIFASLLLLSTSARAQWATESYPLKLGWNAIWVSQDCTHVPIDTLLAGQPNVVEVWRWNPLGSTVQFTSSPANPISS